MGQNWRAAQRSVQLQETRELLGFIRADLNEEGVLTIDCAMEICRACSCDLDTIRSMQDWAGFILVEGTAAIRAVPPHEPVIPASGLVPTHPVQKPEVPACTVAAIKKGLIYKAVADDPKDDTWVVTTHAKWQKERRAIRLLLQELEELRSKHEGI